MGNELSTQQAGALAVEQVVIGGDLSKLDAANRVMYYNQVCKSVGLNPLTKPFEYINLNGKLRLYALRDCTDQLRKINGVSIIIAARETVEGCYVVTARATDKTGRHDEAIGAVPIDGLKGESRSNAMMKAETKAKRRVTLSVCGLGMLDESEADSIPGAYPSPNKPTAGALGSLTAARQEVVNETAAQIRAYLANDQAFDAYSLCENSEFDADEKTALWSLLDSKQRAALKRMGDVERAQKSGTISPAQHKRLEAMIKEYGADRDAVKEFCKDRFETEHFTELTREQYEIVCAEFPKPKSALAAAKSDAEPTADEALLVTAREWAESGIEKYADWWNKLTAAQRKSIGAVRHEEFKAIASKVPA